jgi:hypothetical protein
MAGAADFLSRLVLSEALEGRRPKQSVAGPTAVFDLADEAWLHPTVGKA